METQEARVRARDAALRLLNRLTTGVAISAIAGVGLFSAVGANTIPGTASTTTASSSTASSSSSASTAAGSTSGLATSTTPVTSSSSSGVAVSGGS